MVSFLFNYVVNVGTEVCFLSLIQKAKDMLFFYEDIMLVVKEPLD